MAQNVPNKHDISGHLNQPPPYADQGAVNVESSLDAGREPPLVEYQPEAEEVVQVVYQSNPDGGIVGVESTLLDTANNNNNNNLYEGLRYADVSSTIVEGVESELNPAAINGEQSSDDGSHVATLPQPLRPASILPSVAEESTGASVAYPASEPLTGGELAEVQNSSLGATYFGNPIDSHVPSYGAYQSSQEQLVSSDQYNASSNPNALYSTINRHSRSNSARTFGYELESGGSQQPIPHNSQAENNPIFYGNQSQIPTNPSSLLYESPFYADSQLLTDQSQPASDLVRSDLSSTLQSTKQSLNESNDTQTPEVNTDEQNEYSPSKDQYKTDATDEKENIDDINEEIKQILARQKQGAAESGSLKNNFRKKLGVSVSTNENDLTAHRQKLLESQEANNNELEEEEEEGEPSSLPSRFKRTHSVSFNVGSSRSGRHSVDIRNLPSYLTVKRASIVDVAKGAMSSLIHSFGGAGSGTNSQRRGSSPDEEPIFEEPIAPTLSLGQRVALVKNSGAEFGTVGWIGQLPDVDDDWIVGVIFDNMIGNCDGAHNGVRYFYARQNYAMFVPLSTLTKTDNYIGRPETGTMLSRMSVSLKPGQLISIQRSSIRLQHCFLNAPHQRVGHDVRAVSNRLHCQCHNCGPCAHLTKQGRISALPAFGAHHAPNKKNSLAHAAVEILAHHHHHYHEEEHREEDYQFGDNSAHACNYVRYSCCQQTGTGGHDFSADCELVRPELLDNLIHAPRAPHRRSRLRPSRSRQQQRQPQPQSLEQQQYPQLTGFEGKALEYVEGQSNLTGFEHATNTMSTWNESEFADRDNSESSYSSCSSSSSLRDAQEAQYDNQFTYDSSSYRAGNSVYNTLETRMSLREQQRFICRPESSEFVRSHQSYLSDDYEYQSEGFGSSIKRCFNCILGRKNRRNKPAKRKLSARNRMIEYRRKQSTFVPSTLAKPQEDFASHGISIPPTNQIHHDSNSDYSSYSRSSGSSRSSSPDYGHGDAGGIAIQDAQPFLQQTMTIEHDASASNGQLKSADDFRSQQFSSQINYEDYSYGDGYGSYKKEGYSRDSALTDLGYFDSLTNSSNDTLKQIVDQTINEQVAHPEPIIAGDDLPIISPLSTTESNQSEQVDISSQTASINDLDVCERLECLDLYKDRDDTPADE